VIIIAQKKWLRKAQIKVNVDKVISKQDLADAIGMNYSQLCDIFLGNRVRETKNIIKICDYLGIKYTINEKGEVE